MTLHGLVWAPERNIIYFWLLKVWLLCILLLPDAKCYFLSDSLDCSRILIKFFRSYHKFLHKSSSNFILRISTKHQIQNLNEISAPRLNLNFKILTKPSFKISTMIQLHNINQTSAANILFVRHCIKWCSFETECSIPGGAKSAQPRN